jgi:hypothetical protein
MKMSYLIAAVVLMAAVTGSLVVANSANGDDEITISPSTLALSRNSTVMTIHSSIPYNSVDKVSLTLNDDFFIVNFTTKSDACDDLVVKFNSADIKDEVILGVNELTLSVTPTGGDEFSITDTIFVKE